MENIKFGILGGDYRYKFLYEMFEEDNIDVKIFNNSFVKNNESNLDNLLKNIDVLIAGIPFSKDEKTVFCPDFDELLIEDLMIKMVKYGVNYLLAGVITKKVSSLALKHNIKVFDFFEQESVAVLNAIPTAEGAIQTAIQESERTLFGSKSIVLGYGRCGKILSNMLKGIGSLVSATYRNKKDFSYIKSYGLNPINLNELKNCISEFDFIFNTIPSCILDKNILKKINKNSIIIDLAQAPGGLDYKYARELNLKSLYCPGLPGRVAPFNSAEILKDCIYSYCNANISESL